MRYALCLLFMTSPCVAQPDRPVLAAFRTSPTKTEVYQEVSSSSKPGRFIGTSDRPLWLDARASQLRLTFRAHGFSDLSLSLPPSYFRQHKIWPQEGSIVLQPDSLSGWSARLRGWVLPALAIGAGLVGLFKVWKQRKSGSRFGGYQLLSCIGRGGSANVYMAVPVGLPVERAVALKVFTEPSGDLLQPQGHPGLVLTHFSGCLEGVHYQVMEYLPGGTLRDRLRAGPVSRAQARIWLNDICQALCYAHKHGFVHADLKPENILFTAQGQPRLSDFLGMRDGTGTPAYRAPEQWLAQPVGPWTDQYSLALIAFEMLTGKRVPPPERHLRPLPSMEAGVTSTLDSVLARMSAPLPAERYQDLACAWEELMEAL